MTDKAAPSSTCISAEVPTPIRDSLFDLKDLTNFSVSHLVRMALAEFLASEKVSTMREEAKRFSSIASGREAS